MSVSISPAKSSVKLTLWGNSLTITDSPVLTVSTHSHPPHPPHKHRYFSNSIYSFKQKTKWKSNENTTSAPLFPYLEQWWKSRQELWISTTLRTHTQDHTTKLTTRFHENQILHIRSLIVTLENYGFYQLASSWQTHYLFMEMDLIFFTKPSVALFGNLRNDTWALRRTCKMFCISRRETRFSIRRHGWDWSLVPILINYIILCKVFYHIFRGY